MYLCIDIGGTKTIIALVNRQGQILHHVKFATIYSQTEFYNNLLMHIRANFATPELHAISVAMPGLIKNNRALWLGNLPWRNFDLAKLLHQDFNLPVYVENDADLAALAEARNCKGRSLYFTFSTGIGGGVVEDGQLSSRYKGFEPGHNLYVYNKKEQEWEDIASAHAINEQYGCYVSDIHDDKIWQDIVQRILLGLAPLTISIKPQRIIFGGPLGLALNSYRKELRKKLGDELQINSKHKKANMPRLMIAKYSHLSVIYGCYYYAKLQEKHLKK